MIKVKNRTTKEVIKLHSKLPPRIYCEDNIQNIRIRKTRQLIDEILQSIKVPAKIIELGCGTGDISGIYSDEHIVIGMDCNRQALIELAKRFPIMNICCCDICSIPPIQSDVIVLCEILEHIADPVDLIKKWLPFARYSIISHPIGNTEREDEHMWSYFLKDFTEWFVMGGHELIFYEEFTTGIYQIILGRGERKG